MKTIVYFCKGYKKLRYYVYNKLSRSIASIYPLPGGQRPAGEGANLDWHLVPHHGKCKRIQSCIEFIYIFIYMRHTVLFVMVCEDWVLNTEASNNKSTESSWTETEFKVMRKRLNTQKLG